VLGADAGAGGTELAGGALEFGVGTFAGPTLAGTAAVTDLPVLSEAAGAVQRAVAGAARVVGIADAFSAFAPPVTWWSTDKR